ncbi:uncharacterized protein TM35_000022810 [Trypanosoma theileri]|uniref:Uncharacterized protein n=1 Tax=Trypanosoma theileri TaxID=67003 RepID=A0A1X0P7Y1_9TRYP|nr:uncharacterized protein TM35_000022810 [Trypanosoma theileri]ORC92955.1 hypothetical protein TM35_000022810 [Trypanosoma theileri]
MPKQPQSPQETHSAPPLPEPAGVTGGRPTFYYNSSSWQQERERVHCSMNRNRNIIIYNGKENGVMQRLPSKDEKESFSQQQQQRQQPAPAEEELQRQRDPPPSLEIFLNRESVISHSPVKKKTSTRDDRSLVQDEVVGANLQERSPEKIMERRRRKRTTTTTTTTTTEAIPATHLPEWEEEEEEEQHTSIVSLTPTAYEAALAKYGKKLLSMTQKQLQEKQKNRKESLTRRKAVNEKYSEWSRPSIGNGRPVQIVPTTHRKGEVNSVILNGNDNASCSNGVNVGMGLRTREPQKDVFNSTTLHNNPQRKLFLDLDESTATTNGLCNSKSHTIPMQGQKEKKNEYRKDGLKREMKNSNLAVKVYTHMDDVYEKNYRRGGYRSNSVAHINNIHDTTRPKKTTSTIIKLRSRKNLFSFEDPPIEESHISRSHYIIPPKEDNVLDDLHFVPPHWFTPPRPLRRLCTSESYHSSPNHDRDKSKHELQNPFADKQQCYYDPYISSYPHSCSPPVIPSGRSTTGQQALVFIRPQEKPRPLPRRSETAVRSDEDLWSVREASFRRCTSSEENQRYSGRDNEHGMDLFTTRDNPISGLSGNTGRQGHESVHVAERKRCVFRNVVPQYILDGFAQRCLLRLAWRRWKERLREKQSVLPGNGYIHIYR